LEIVAETIRADFQKNVLTATGLAGKSETYALEVIGNPIWTRVRDHFLAYDNGTFWVSDRGLSEEVLHRRMYLMIPLGR
jgi:hypothetical protein